MRMPGEAHALVRHSHQERVLRALRERGALSRGELAEAVGLSRTTISEITRDLLGHGSVVVLDTDADSRAGSGRPAERLVLDPDSGQFMGVDFGHRRVRVAVADASHEVVVSGRQAYPDNTGWPERISIAFDLIDRLSAERGVHFRALQGIGIGVTGPHPRSSAPLAPEGVFGPGFAAARDDVDVSFAERFGASVIVENNTRFAALAEALAGGADDENLLYVRLSDGVGGALVIGGQIVSGATGLAGELGHVTVAPGGARCRCGKSGCLETVASVPSMLAACRERGADIGTIDELASSADPVVKQVLREAASAVGAVVGTVAMVFNPAEIVIGGEIARLTPVLVERTSEALGEELFPWVAARPVVRAARLADDDGAIGALAALFRSAPLLADQPEPAPVRALPA